MALCPDRKETPRQINLQPKAVPISHGRALWRLYDFSKPHGQWLFSAIFVKPLVMLCPQNLSHSRWLMLELMHHASDAYKCSHVDSMSDILIFLAITTTSEICNQSRLHLRHPNKKLTSCFHHLPFQNSHYQVPDLGIMMRESEAKQWEGECAKPDRTSLVSFVCSSLPSRGKSAGPRVQTPKV